MSKIKDTILDEREFANKELEASEPKSADELAEAVCQKLYGKSRIEMSESLGLIPKGYKGRLCYGTDCDEDRCRCNDEE